MEFSGGHLVTIEAQNLPEDFHDPRRRRYFSMNFINKTLRSLGFLQAEREESAPEFYNNLTLPDFFDLPGEYVLMNAEMFSALRDGNKSCLEKFKSHGTPIACLKSRHGGDSVLHLIAASGNLEGVKSIISECPCLLLEPNWKNQLPLHVAARAGYLNVVDALIAAITFFLGKLSEEERETMHPYLVKDINGDTALSLALISRHMKIADSLVKVYQQASFYANKDGISPLYLAVDIGNVSLVKKMFGNDDSETQLEGRQYLAHVALKCISKDMLDVVLNKYPSLMNERDEEGRTYLSFAAFVGCYKGVCNLLDRSTSSIFECDDDGSYPIHMAVQKNRIEVVAEILRRCPHSKYLLNKKEQNILHIAALRGNSKLVRQLKAFYHLADEQDADGNTPLHLATIKWRPKTVKLLATRKNFKIQNNSGFSPLDIVESNLQPCYVFRERLTLMVLVQEHIKNDTRLLGTMNLTRPSTVEANKEFINALIVVAALVATATFAACFTIPGGYKSSGVHAGRAVISASDGFKIFLMLDYPAMICSVVAMVLLIWAQLGDPAVTHSLLNKALPLLHISVFLIWYAFNIGIYIASGRATWLNCIITIATILLALLLALISLPHILLQRRHLYAMITLDFMFLVNDIED